LGADVCINYKTEDFVARIKEETDGKGMMLHCCPFVMTDTLMCFVVAVASTYYFTKSYFSSLYTLQL
jgi:hypothetical protein